MASSRGRVIAALDVGSSKVSCFIAHVGANAGPGTGGAGGLEVLGAGYRVARGMRGGAVVNMDAVADSISGAVEDAERQACETVRDIYVSLSAGAPASHIVDAEVAVSGHEISDHDLQQVLAFGRAYIEENGPPSSEIIHAQAVSFTIDGARGIADPRGMYGERLGVKMHIVTANSGPLHNLILSVERGHLRVAGMIAAPYASGLACLVEGEKELGVTCIDIGGGVTSVAVFEAGALIHVDVIPVGGCHVTNDIARGLSTAVDQAERIKTLRGSAIAGPNDHRDLIDVPLIGEVARDQANHVSQLVLNSIIQPRLEEIFELVRGRLEAAGISPVTARRVVLTGGGSQMQGLADLAGRILDRPVRVGRPVGFDAVAEARNGPAFSTCAGLLRYIEGGGIEAEARANHKIPALASGAGEGGSFGRFGRWLKQNF